MQTPDASPAPARRSTLRAIAAWMAAHQKIVHSLEIVIFFSMILLQLWGADLLGSWRGWAIAMFGMLFGMSVVMLFGTKPFGPRAPAAD